MSHRDALRRPCPVPASYTRSFPCLCLCAFALLAGCTTPTNAPATSGEDDTIGPMDDAGGSDAAATDGGLGSSDAGGDAMDPADPADPAGDPPVLEDMGLHEVSLGDVFTFVPNIEGEVVVCRKDLGHDDVVVDSETGEITWDTSGLAFGRGFHVRIKCSNYAGATYASMVVHVDGTGSSRLRVAGEGGVSPWLAPAGMSMASGDTIVFPDGLYPVSVSADESYENAFKETSPTPGTPGQLSTLITRTPGGVVVSGEAHDGIPKQKNAFQLVGADYVAIVGFVARDVRRTSFQASGDVHVLVDFVGSAGTGTNGLPCSNFAEAADGWCSQAGLRVNQGNPIIQNSYDWGHNRYGIMTRSTSGSVTRRSFVRVDEHRGDQPFGGFSDYCDTAHLSQDNTVFDTLAIAAPHYKNYAGLSAFPATGCENVPATLATTGLLAVNNDLSLSLMDQKAGPVHRWDSIVSYDSEGTCTPQTSRCGRWLLQADKDTVVVDSFFGAARGFEGGTNGGAFGDNVALDASVSISDVAGMADQGTAPRYLPQSQLYFRGRSDTFYGDPAYDTPTTVRRWPIGGEDIIADNMRSYRNPQAFAVGGGTVDIDGDRGATATGESMSEYFWAYLDGDIPPLVVRVKAKGAYNRIAWEHLSSADRRARVTGWRVVCMSQGGRPLADLAEDDLVFHDDSGRCDSYGVQALYAGAASGIAYPERAQ